MKLYARLNAVVDYLEEHLEEGINQPALARRAGMSYDTLRKLFPHLAGLTLVEYLRYRRLTLAGRDLVQADQAVADLAAKYGYNSLPAFTRAFQKFHGVSPGVVRSQGLTLKFFPKLTFAQPHTPPHFSYEILELDDFELYGMSVVTDFRRIKHDAPRLFDEAELRYPQLGHPDYGMISYHHTREAYDGYEYWVLWKNQHTEMKPYRFAASRWLRIRVPSQKAEDIQRTSDWFYEEFLPECGYNLRLEPELEHYHDGITDILFPIR